MELDSSTHPVRRYSVKKHFPDNPERIKYPEKQAELYWSGKSRILRAKKAKKAGKLRSFKLTPEEQDAFDYFFGNGFYTYHQNPETSPKPNIFDTRRNFLLKM